MTYGKHFSAAATPQSQPLPGRDDMIKNAAGGYTFELDDWARLRRFLILGCEGGTYYASEAKLTKENAETAIRCIKADGKRVVRETVEVSDKGLAPKNEPAIFVLACASHFGDESTRKAALAVLPDVCRIGTHLFRFCEYRQAIGGGWGRGIRAAVSKWYRRPHAELIMQALKYQQRNGWSHRDVLRLAHPIASDDIYKAVYDAICRPDKWEGLQSFPVVAGYLKAQKAKDAKTVAAIIREHRLQREMIPTEFLVHADVWDALLPSMGYTALIRNLGNLSKCGLLKPFSDCARFVQGKLSDGDAIRKARVHPWHVLLASRTYGKGSGFRGSGSWQVVPQVVEVLDQAFELAFHNVEPTSKRYILGIDVSGSMSSNYGDSPITVAEAAAAMALITVRTEPQYWAFGFATKFKDLRITKRDSLNDVLTKTRHMNFGGTDCAVPIRWARQNKVQADAVLVYTDNETWAGPTHAASELQAYRREIGPLKLGFIAFEATPNAVADPQDAGSMNFVGMDASLPQAINAFIT